MRLRVGARVAVIGGRPVRHPRLFSEQLAASPRVPVDPADLDAMHRFGRYDTAARIAPAARV